MLNESEQKRLELYLETLRDNSPLYVSQQLWLALKLNEINVQLSRKINEEKSNRPNEKAVIEQAKQLMMSRLEMTEEQAHGFIVRQSMRDRTTKFKIAKRYIESVTK